MLFLFCFVFVVGKKKFQLFSSVFFSSSSILSKKNEKKTHRGVAPVAQQQKVVVASSAAAHARQLREPRRGLGGLGRLVVGALRPLRDRERVDDRGGRQRQKGRARQLLLLLYHLMLNLAASAAARPLPSRSLFPDDEDDLGELGEAPLAERAGGLDVGPSADAGVAETDVLDFFFWSFLVEVEVFTKRRSREREKKRLETTTSIFFSLFLRPSNSRVLAAVEAAGLDDILRVADAAGEGRDGGLLRCRRPVWSPHGSRSAFADGREQSLASSRDSPLLEEKK